MLATGPGPLRLYPALTVEPQATIAQFDAQQPEGADYVIVPAMSRDKDAAALQWIRSQAGKGATIIGVCAGAKVVAAAGLLEGKRATTHWYCLEDLLEISPTAAYVENRRFVIDGRVATTTGITASRPMMRPANAAMMRWPLDAIPQEWRNWRNRWEYGHAVRAGPVMTALGALTWSLLQDRRSAKRESCNNCVRWA